MTRTTILEVQAAPASGILAGRRDRHPRGRRRTAPTGRWTCAAGRSVRTHARSRWRAVYDGQRAVARSGGRRAAADRGRARRRARRHGSGSTPSAGTLPLAPEFEVRGERRPATRRAASSARPRSADAGACCASSFEPRRSPLMVTTLGRTGSMLLMRLLSGPPGGARRTSPTASSSGSPATGPRRCSHCPTRRAIGAASHPPDRSRRQDVDDPAVVARARRPGAVARCATRPCRSGSGARRWRHSRRDLPAADRGGIRDASSRRPDAATRAFVRREVQPPRGSWPAARSCTRTRASSSWCGTSATW